MVKLHRTFKSYLSFYTFLLTLTDALLPLPSTHNEAFGSDF